MLEAIGRRLRRNYGWIFAIQVVAYVGKLMIHPCRSTSLGEVWQRASIGPIPGQLVLLAGLLFHGSWITVAVHDPAQPARWRPAAAEAAAAGRDPAARRREGIGHRRQRLALGQRRGQMDGMLPLSVLDLSFTTTDTAGAAAVRNTVELARWSTRSAIAAFGSPSTTTCLGRERRARDHDRRRSPPRPAHLRVGSGGVMLPNHAPLMVAERFKVLEALYPGRIDLGIGRAPGTDPMTSLALRRRQDIRADDDFLERFNELMLWKTGSFPDGHPFRAIRVMPEDVPVPPIWLLGSGAYSAELAGRVGLGFAFAHHFASIEAADAIGLYREQLPGLGLAASGRTPSWPRRSLRRHRRRGRVARRHVDFSYVRRMSGDYRPLVSPEEATS